MVLHRARSPNGMRNVFKEFPAVGQGRRQTGIVGENCVLILVRVIPIEEPRRLKRGDVGKTKPQSESARILLTTAPIFAARRGPVSGVYMLIFQHSRALARPGAA